VWLLLTDFIEEVRHGAGGRGDGADQARLQERREPIFHVQTTATLVFLRWQHAAGTHTQAAVV